jgi:hypothetical protein
MVVTAEKKRPGCGELGIPSYGGGPFYGGVGINMKVCVAFHHRIIAAFKPSYQTLLVRYSSN